MEQRPYPIKECDVLVIGSGSGAFAALEAAKQKGLRILLASRGPVGMSGLTPTAIGGVASSSSVDTLFTRMVEGGLYLNDQDVAWRLVNGIASALENLKSLGIVVTPTSGRLVTIPGGDALKVARKEILKRPNIELWEDVQVTSLLTSQGRVAGATILDLARGEFFVVRAKTVVLATGGSTGELYPHTSNNPFGMTTGSAGTGHIMAYHAGAELVDMEMIQFVPVVADPRCLYLRYFPEFWDGPYLNRLGDVVESDINRYVAQSYSPELTHKLFQEIAKGNGPIYIDKRSAEAGESRRPIKSQQIRQRLISSLGIDPRHNKIEVVLGSHFSMGGVRVNGKTASTLPGLYAAGEIMGCVHGAVRLGSYSLAQVIMFGFEAGAQAARYALTQEIAPPPAHEAVDREREQVFQFLEPKAKPLSVAGLKEHLQKIMAQYAFVERDKAGLSEALRQIGAIKENIPRIAVPPFRRYNLEWLKALEFLFTVEAAEIVVRSALVRQESRGFHYRKDFPERDDTNWLCHTVAKLDQGQLVMGTAPVQLTRLRPEV